MAVPRQAATGEKLFSKNAGKLRVCPISEKSTMTNFSFFLCSWLHFISFFTNKIDKFSL